MSPLESEDVSGEALDEEVASQSQLDTTTGNEKVGVAISRIVVGRLDHRSMHPK